MSALTYKKNDDIESGSLDKMTVFQDCMSGFNASPIMPKKCRLLLSKLAHLLSSGETFPADEATALFFSVTKLFQHKDPSLRQMVYVVIKELAPIANDVIMVTSSIMKDVQGSNELIYKPNAIRALCRIIDGSIVQGIERLMKTAIVDKNPSISSAALVSSYQLLPIAKDTVRRWANETQECVVAQKSFPPGALLGNYHIGVSTLSQYHALGLLYQIRAHDRMALMKMVQQLSGPSTSLKSSNAIIMLIRFISRIISDDQNLRAPLYVLLENWLRHKSDMVNLEAAKIILNIKGISEEEATPAVNVLQQFLSSPRTVYRFAAIRAFSKFAMVQPVLISHCNIEIENLLSDTNRSIATYAITTLLQTGNETSVDRLLTQINGFMNDISDDFKIIIIEAVRSLALKFPTKHVAMLKFLADCLRDEGGIKVKTTIVESIFDMIKYVPDSKDEALGHLCEFIEDCEFTDITVRVLHMLGVEGPATSEPTMYIRYIYNRVVLENAVIRASAVSALAKFALTDDKEVRDSVVVLLRRCLEDVTDEVRDRAAVYLKVIGLDKQVAESYINPGKDYSLPVLEQELAQYVSGDREQFSTPFDMSTIPQITEEQAKANDFKIKSKANHEPEAAKADIAKEQMERALKEELTQQTYASTLASIAQFTDYGKILNSSKIVQLSESETEFVVSAVKHLFKDHLVIQYDINNTLKDTILEDVSVISIPDNEDIVEEFIIPIDTLSVESAGTVYVSFVRPTGEYPVTGFENNLKFTLKEIDPSSGEPEEDGFEDEYQIESLSLSASDYMIPTYAGSFVHQWDELRFDETFSIRIDAADLQEACTYLIETLNMMPLESSDVPVSTSQNTLKLFGKTVDGVKTVVQIRMIYSASNGVAIKIHTRAQEEAASALVIETFTN
ncbi:Coatomer, gamma subunit [Nadsonia fulvescens var. elongata DSM 6958]|uniref:Coatomer subunit gamma n=1 Tax=Nadsonia fulvescens var. elongata DSM 6958 TaxID=857566 RepID=A0A1E3PFD5_9ASCO|nr:Coatomer, gamma subunit [Nadsonia fulvescens var. elongata DSM 6958]